MSSLFKFRKYKKIEGGTHKRSRYQKLIVDEDDKNLGFMGLTESKNKFEEILRDYHLCDTDIAKILKYVEKHKKKK